MAGGNLFPHPAPPLRPLCHRHTNHHRLFSFSSSSSACPLPVLTHPSFPLNRRLLPSPAMAPRTVAKVALALALPLALWTTAVAAADSVDVRSAASRERERATGVGWQGGGGRGVGGGAGEGERHLSWPLSPPPSPLPAAPPCAACSEMEGGGIPLLASGAGCCLVWGPAARRRWRARAGRVGMWLPLASAAGWPWR